MSKYTLESPLDCKEIKSVNPEGNQSWIIERTDAEAEAPVLWLPDAKSWLTGKEPDAGKDWRQEEKGSTEDETVGWHHWLNGHKFKQTPGDRERQGNLACCSVSKCRTGLRNWTIWWKKCKTKHTKVWFFYVRRTESRKHMAICDTAITLPIAIGTSSLWLKCHILGNPLY